MNTFRPLRTLALAITTALFASAAQAEATSDGYFIDLLRLRVKQLAERSDAQQQPLWGQVKNSNGTLDLLQSIDQARQQGGQLATTNDDGDQLRSCIDNLHIAGDGGASRNPSRACTTRYATRSYMQKGVYPLLGATVQGRLPNSSAEVGFIPPNITFLTFYTGNGRVSEVLLVSNESDEAITTR
jgi:hypothetical protein